MSVSYHPLYFYDSFFAERPFYWCYSSEFEGCNSSQDFWKLISRADGTHELIDDGKKYLTIEYQDKDENVLGSVVPGGQAAIDQANSMGWAASLGNVVGLDRASEILGSSLMNTDIYDTQTLMDVLNMTEDQVKQIQHSGSLDGISLTQDQKLSFAGEALLKNAGASWNGDIGHWIGTGNLSDYVSLTDRARLEGGIAAIINSQGGYDYSTVSMGVGRDPRSYLVYNGQGSPNSQYKGLDTITVTQRDLDGNLLNQKGFDGWTTVQTTLPGDGDGSYGAEAFVDMGWQSIYGGAGTIKVGPETIAEGPIAYELVQSDFTQISMQIYPDDPYLQAVSASLLASGYSIGANGDAGYGLADGRHLQHATNYFTNTGCLVTGNLAGGVTGIGTFNSYTNYLTNTLGLSYGTVMFGNLYQKYDPYFTVNW